MTTAVQGSSTRSPRFTKWVAFLAFSCIVLASTIEANKNYKATKSSELLPFHRWAVVCSVLTFVVALVTVFMHMIPVCSLFVVGTKLEGFLCVLLVAFWAAQVFVVSDPRHGLAVASDGAVSNGNLYYFSWAGLVCAVMMLTSFFHSAFAFNVADAMKTRAARLSHWSALLAASFVVMVSSLKIQKTSCHSGDNYGGNWFCRRTLFGIVLGSLGFALAFFVVAMKVSTGKTFFVAESLFASSLVIGYAFGVAYLTQSAAPGGPLGNLYYFTWASFFLNFMLCGSLYEEYFTITRAPQQVVQQQQHQQELSQPSNFSTTGAPRLENMDEI